MNWLISLTFLLPVLGLLPLCSAAPTCDDLTITVHAAANVHKIPLSSLNIDLTDRKAVKNLLNSALGTASRVFPIIPVSGTYDISARYCEPEVENGNSKTVQILAHGATYTKTYWTGLDLPEEQAEGYSWVHYASREGYPTLSIDRLGTGKSTHANPVLEVQVNLDAETIHEIIKKLRAGEIKRKRFEKVVFAGHSLGSAVGCVLSQRHPDDIDALILTGWSDALVENVSRVLSTGFIPAALVDGDRWGNREVGYLTTSLEENVRSSFYGPDGSYDPQVRDYAWKTRDIVSAAEFVTTFAGAVVSDRFRGPVHFLTGEFDALMCDGSGGCKDDPNHTPASNRKLFPNSRNYTYHIVPDAGHNINFHYSARNGYKAAHDFLRYNL